jgi:hypothetical protein
VPREGKRKQKDYGCQRKLLWLRRQEERERILGSSLIFVKDLVEINDSKEFYRLCTNKFFFLEFYPE